MKQRLRHIGVQEMVRRYELAHHLPGAFSDESEADAENGGGRPSPAKQEDADNLLYFSLGSPAKQEDDPGLHAPPAPDPCSAVAHGLGLWLLGLGAR